MRLYCPARDRKGRRSQRGKTRKERGRERRVEDGNARLTLVIGISSEKLEQLDDGSRRIELEVGQSLGVAGDRNGERSSVENDGVEESEVVLHDGGRSISSRWAHHRDPSSQSRHQSRDRSIRVNAVLQGRSKIPRLQDRSVVRKDGWDAVLVHVSFGEVVGEGIGEGVVSREGREDDVPELDAVRRDGFDEGVVVFGEELGEVVEEDEENPHRSLEEDSGRFLHLWGGEEGGEELEEGDEEGVVLGPVL